MTRRTKGHEAPLDELVDWDGLGRVTVRDVVKHFKGSAYKEAFIRRAIAEGDARSLTDLARWEGEMRRRTKIGGLRASRHPNSHVQVVPKKRSKPWPL